MCEVTRHVAIQELIAHAQSLQQLGQDESANAVDAVDADGEACLTDSLGIHQLQVEYRLDMPIVETIVHSNMSQLVDLGIAEVLLLSQSQHLGAVGSRQELALAVEQFQGIPLTRVMRGGDDDAAVGTAHAYCQLCRWRRRIANVQDVKAHPHQGATNHVAHHRSRDASITSYDDFLAFAIPF